MDNAILKNIVYCCDFVVTNTNRQLERKDANQYATSFREILELLSSFIAIFIKEINFLLFYEHSDARDMKVSDFIRRISLNIGYDKALSDCNFLFIFTKVTSNPHAVF